MMRTTVTRHPVALEALGRLRGPESSGESFRGLLRRYTQVLTTEATGDLDVVEQELHSATGHPATVHNVCEAVTLLPILRAGLGMLDGALDILPQAAIGFIGLARDHGTLRPEQYYCNLPNMRGGVCIILDPMIATGGSVSATIDLVEEQVHPDRIIVISLIASPEGIAALEAGDRPGRNLRIHTGSVDRELDVNGYIVPGLGDAGDRICGGN